MGLEAHQIVDGPLGVVPAQLDHGVGLPARGRVETAIGALGLYVSDETVGSFQPMNINFGIITPLGYRVKGKRNKNQEISARIFSFLNKSSLSENFDMTFSQKA